MSASEAATAASRRASGHSRRPTNGVKTTLAGPAGDVAASTHLERHFALRCADLP